MFGDSSSTVDLTNITTGVDFPYSNVSITKVDINRDGGVWLGGSYEVYVYYIVSGYSASASFRYRSETNTAQLDKLSLQLKLCNLVSPIFSATNAFIVTYYQNPATNNASLLNSFQLILTTDGTLSYLVFNYERLDQIDTTSWKGFRAPNGIHINFIPSLNGSNCNVPGQYVFRVDGGGKYLKYIYLKKNFITVNTRFPSLRITFFRPNFLLDLKHPKLIKLS